MIDVADFGAQKRGRQNSSAQFEFRPRRWIFLIDGHAVIDLEALTAPRAEPPSQIQPSVLERQPPTIERDLARFG